MFIGNMAYFCKLVQGPNRAYFSFFSVLWIKGPRKQINRVQIRGKWVYLAYNSGLQSIIWRNQGRSVKQPVTSSPVKNKENRCLAPLLLALNYLPLAYDPPAREWCCPQWLDLPMWITVNTFFMTCPHINPIQLTLHDMSTVSLI